MLNGLNILLKKLSLYLILVCSVFITKAQNNKKDYPYELSKVDYAWLGAGIVTWSTGYLIANQTEPLSYETIEGLNANNINSFDRSSTNQWNTSLDGMSHVGKYALALSPGLMMLPPMLNKEWKVFATYSLMYFETALLTTGLTELTKSLSQRIRPFYYNSSFSTEEKQHLGESYGDQDSFISGHSALAFSSAVFLSSTYSEIYGNNNWSKAIWAGSLTLAVGTSYLRYESGQHFPTDIIAGAALGATIGYLIPYFHKTKNSTIGFMISPNQFYLSCRF